MGQVEAPVGYMQRTREYYRALGYSPDYVWSQYDDVPFTFPPRPLAEMRLALVTTSSPVSRENRDARGVKHVWSGAVSPPPAALYTDDLAWDRESTHTRDVDSFLPITAARSWASQGRFAGLAGHFHGISTEYSQRKTIKDDAPELLQRLRDQNAEGAILCPI